MALWETIEALVKLFERTPSPFKKRKRIAEIMLDSTDVRELAKEIVEDGDLCIDFCYLIYSFNGKRKSKDHKFKYRTLISGYHTGFLFQKFKVENHRKLIVDNQYSSMLERVIEETVVILDVWKMDESWLRKELIHLEFNMMGFYLIDNDNEKHELWTLVVGSKTLERTDFQTPAHDTVIKIALGKLKNMIDSQR